MASSAQKELEPELRDAGNRLLTPPSSTDELLNLLDKVEILLSKVEQAPSKSMEDAILPSREALIADQFLRHSDMEVKASVVCCINEVIRITAPDAPYDDEKLKEVFQLTVAALEKLSNVSGRCYNKALSILDTVANVRSCLVMLDLECDELIVEMFQHFLRIIRSNHPKDVFSDMESIMTLVVEESEEISKELLIPLLTSLKKENQIVSPLSWKLGENVMRNCAAKLKPYLQEAVNSMGIVLDDYAEVVSSICQGASLRENLETSEKNLQEKKDSDEPSQEAKALVPDGDVDDLKSLKTSEPFCQTKENGTDASTGTHQENLDSTKGEAVPKKRGWKPNSLRKPEEGYEHSWIIADRKSLERPRRRKKNEKKIDDSSSKVPEPEKEAMLQVFSPTAHDERESTSPAQNPSFSDGTPPKRGRPKRKGSQSTDVILRNESEKTRNSEENLDRGKTVKTTPVSIVKTEVGISSEPEGNQVSSAQQSDGKKRSRGKTESKRCVSEGSRDKKKVSLSVTKSLTQGETNVDEVLGRECKGELTPTKENDPEMPSGDKDNGEGLIGCKIKVWWPMDETFYEGAVQSFDPLKKKHRVLYADGDEEILDLCQERWELVGRSNFPDQGHETLLPSPDALSDMPPKKKAKANSGSLTKNKTADSISRSVGNAAKKSKVEAPKSGTKSTDRSTTDTLRIVDTLSATSKQCENLNSDGQKSTGKAKTEMPKTIVKRKRGRTQLDLGSEVGESGDTAKRKNISSRKELRGDTGKGKLPKRPLDSQERETKSGKKRPRLVKT